MACDALALGEARDRWSPEVAQARPLYLALGFWELLRADDISFDDECLRTEVRLGRPKYTGTN